MRKLAVFDLPAVIRYDSDLLHYYLVEAINKVEDSSLKARDLPAFDNASRMIADLYREKLQRELLPKQLEKIQKKFTKRIKKYFLDEDDSFEIRPGVQSIFGQIEKEKQWKYCILSPYSSDATHLMLQSCGVFSKNKYTITADDALSQEDQIKIILQRGRKKNKKLRAFLISGQPNPLMVKGVELIKPHFSRKDPRELSYPRFAEFFKGI